MRIFPTVLQVSGFAVRQIRLTFCNQGLPERTLSKVCSQNFKQGLIDPLAVFKQGPGGCVKLFGQGPVD
jgi:hypothetical protein